MPSDPILAERPEEQLRLRTLYDYCVLDSGQEAQYDELALLASRICETPVALISLVDIDRLYFKAAIGLDRREANLEHSFCGHAIRQREVFVVPDALADLRFAGSPQVAGSPQYRFYAAAPLLAPNGCALGTLCVMDFNPRAITDLQRDSLGILARQVVAQLELRLQSARDSLTGLLHRAYMEEALAALLYRARRKTAPLSVVMLDLDSFRQLNETAGHAGGDAVLRALAELLKTSVRREDAACRYGGDEFVLILPDMNAATAQRRVDAVRSQLRQLKLGGTQLAVGSITASYGIACYPDSADNAKALIGAAQKAMLRAQALGHDRIMLAR